MIVRAKRNTNFTIMSNVGLNDSRLSLKAKGMLAHLLSKPDNWTVSDRQLSTIGPDGRAAVQAALKELETCGYLERVRVRNEDGTFTWVSTIFDEPRLGYPATDEPATVQPATDNRAKISTVGKRTVRTKTEEQSSSSPTPSPSASKNDDDKVIFDAWSQNIPGMMTPILAEKLHALIDECGVPSVLAGITVGVEAGARNLKYITACARNHAAGVDKSKSTYKPKLTEQERTKLLTRAKVAQSASRTAEQFGGLIDPAWQRDIAIAREAGVI